MRVSATSTQRTADRGPEIEHRSQPDSLVGRDPSYQASIAAMVLGCPHRFSREGGVNPICFMSICKSSQASFLAAGLRKRKAG